MFFARPNSLVIEFQPFYQPRNGTEIWQGRATGLFYRFARGLGHRYYSVPSDVSDVGSLDMPVVDIRKILWILDEQYVFPEIDCELFGSCA